MTRRAHSDRVRAALCVLGATALLAGCGSGTIPRTESGPPHVLSVTVPVSVSTPASQTPPAATTPAAPAPAPQAGQGDQVEPPGQAKKHDHGHGHGGHGGGDKRAVRA